MREQPGFRVALQEFVGEAALDSRVALFEKCAESFSFDGIFDLIEEREAALIAAKYGGVELL